MYFERKGRGTRMEQSRSLKTKIRRRLSKLKREAYYALQAIRGFKRYYTDVDLGKILIGTQCGKKLEKWVRITHEWDRVSCQLKDSPYVRFLTEVSEDEQLLNNDRFLENQPYYRMAETAIEFAGSYFAAKTPDTIKSQMRRFYETYRSFRDGSQCNDTVDDYRHSAPDDPVVMHKIFASDCYEIEDGHHRTAISYVLGKNKMTALIVGERKTYLQELLLRTQANKDIVLHQPVDKLEVAGWAVREGCEERMALMAAFLTGTSLELESQITTVLDLECGYGWFLQEFCKMGFDVTGISRNQTAMEIGRIAYGLNDDQLLQEEMSAFLDKPNQNYDLVLFLNALGCIFSKGISEGEEKGMFQKIDKLTGKILILGSGQGSDTCSSQNNFGYDCEHLKSLILENTSFNQIVILGKETAKPGRCSDKNTEILLACIR